MDRATAEHIKADVATVLDGFDKGVFVRNTDGDTAPDWAVKLLPFISALWRLRRFVSVLECNKCGAKPADWGWDDWLKVHGEGDHCPLDICLGTMHYVATDE